MSTPTSDSIYRPIMTADSILPNSKTSEGHYLARVGRTFYQLGVELDGKVSYGPRSVLVTEPDGTVTSHRLLLSDRLYHQEVSLCDRKLAANPERAG